MFSLQLSLVSVADNSHFCLFHINPYAKHKILHCLEFQALFREHSADSRFLVSRCDIPVTCKVLMTSIKQMTSKKCHKITEIKKTISCVVLAARSARV